MANNKDYDKYKKLLLGLKVQILNHTRNELVEQRFITPDDLADEADYASTMTSQQMALSLQERELVKLRLIDRALMKMNEGHYGECEDCGDQIGEKRLSKQPWADLCLEHAEEYEREQKQIMKLRKA